MPWKAGAFMGAKPTRAVATLRVVPVRDSNGDSLRATAIHQTLFAWVGLPFCGAVLAVHDRMPLVFVVVSGMGLFAHLMTQGMWWAWYGSVLRESAALALETVGKAVEAEALPTTTNAD